MPKVLKTDTQEYIKQECDDIKKMLLRKNKEYGDSAINPIKIFSSADALELINVRIDDKLSRIKNRETKNIKEDTEMDLIGYLILKRVFQRSSKGPKGFKCEKK